MKRRFLIVLALVVAFAVGVVSVYAADALAFKSKGRIEYDANGNGVLTDDVDVVFDASDFTTIDSMITEGKGLLADSLNAYANTEVATLDTFANLSSAIDNLTTFPEDTYFYDKTTGVADASTLIRYIKEDGTYYLCNENGIKTSDEVQTVDEANLVEYTTLTSENLTAGTAGMVDKAFVLGDGSDNINYSNSYSGKIYKLGTGTSFNICSIVGAANVEKYNNDNFIAVWSAPTGSFPLCGNHGANNNYIVGTSNSTFSIGSNPSVSYDATTGIITATRGTISMSFPNTQGNTISGSLSVYPTIYFIDTDDVQLIE